MRKNYIFTSESVSEGHPDKVSDRISDAVVDHFISKDPFARVACETLTTTNKVVLSGEVRGPVQEDKDEIISKVRECIKDIGYEQDGFHWQTADIQYLLHGQSADIAMGVDSSSDKDEGAGDQGIMFGYACKETPALMPAPIYYSHKILEDMAIKRKNGETPGIQPDSKSQVTLQYNNGSPEKCTKIVVSTQHDENLDHQGVSEIIIPIIKNVMPEQWMNNETEILIIATGNFVIGGICPGEYNLKITHPGCIDFFKKITIENNLSENTIVVYTSDQGFYLGEHGWFDKRFIYDQSFKTPLLIKWPNVIKPGITNDELVQNLDYAQTFLEAATVSYTHLRAHET